MSTINAQTLFVLLTVSVAALSGCLESQDDEIPARLDETVAPPEDQTDTVDPVAEEPPALPAIEIPAGAIPVRIPNGAFDPSADLLWYELTGTTIPSGATLFFINEDTVYHRVLGFLSPTPMPEAPAWTAEAGHHGNHTGGEHHDEGDHDDGATDHDGGHGGHEHGSSTLFDIDLLAGETMEVTVEGDGTLTLHCHPHPWMESAWTLLPAETEYPLVAHQIILNGTTSGGLALGHGAEDTVEVPLNVTSPNLSTLSVEVTWDDSANDGPGGADYNGPDTLTLQLVSPQGWVVAQTTGTDRVGNINVSFHDDAMELPGTLVAAGLAEAGLALDGLGGDAWMGTWLLRVTLDAAPGYYDDGGEFHDAPPEAGFDGSQDFNLTVQGVHEYVTLDGEPTTTYMEYHLESAEHEH